MDAPDIIDGGYGRPQYMLLYYLQFYTFIIHVLSLSNTSKTSVVHDDHSSRSYGRVVVYDLYGLLCFPPPASSFLA